MTELKDLFAGAGTVLKANVVKGADGRSRGFGTVLFPSESEARAAIDQFDQFEWQGRKLNVREDSNSSSIVDDTPQFDKSEHPDCVTIQVANVPFAARWKDMMELCESFGTVLHANVLMEGGRSRGLATVTFADAAGAQTAIEALNEQEWNGRTLRAREDRKYERPTREYVPRETNPAEIKSYSSSVGTPGSQLYVGNLSYTLQWQELKDIFRRVGTVLRANVNMNAEGRSRGFGVIVMSSPEEATRAIAELNGFDLDGRALDVRLDKYQPDGSFAASKPGFNVKVSGLPTDLKWQDLKDFFRPNFSPVHAQILAQGNGLVKFESLEDAQAAVEALNGAELNGTAISLLIE